MSGQPQGIRYPALAAVLDMLGVADRPAVFAGVRVMESAALTEFNRAAERRNRGRR